MTIFFSTRKHISLHKLVDEEPIFLEPHLTCQLYLPIFCYFPILSAHCFLHRLCLSMIQMYLKLNRNVKVLSTSFARNIKAESTIFITNSLFCNDSSLSFMLIMYQPHNVKWTQNVYKFWTHNPSNFLKWKLKHYRVTTQSIKPTLLYLIDCPYAIIPSNFKFW